MATTGQPTQMVPVKQGLYKMSPDRPVCLLACRCPACAEIFFPRRGVCQNCQSENLQPLELGSRGFIFSHTTVMQRPPGLYQGPVPYAFGWVELPEGVRVETLFSGCPPDKLRIGMEVELVFETLHVDQEGRQVVCHKFRPLAMDAQDALNEASAHE